jgi:hypothetical protein
VPVEAPTDAFREFTRNLDDARKLVHGGRRLAQLKVGAFDVDDLYRAGWVQAVAALDHWVTRELIDRAVILAKDRSLVRPPKFNRLKLRTDEYRRRPSLGPTALSVPGATETIIKAFDDLFTPPGHEASR